MAEQFHPPGNLKDFDDAASPQHLRDEWDRTMNDIVGPGGGARPAFYNPLHPPSAVAPALAKPEWTGLPRTIKRMAPGSIAASARLVEDAIPMGRPDPMEGPTFTKPFLDAAGRPFAGPAYRPQDEYLEWVTRKASDGTITEIIFTCEGPEYWDHIALDHDLLLKMYQKLLDDTTIPLSDLLFPKAVTWDNPNNGTQQFAAGDYNPYNKWNIKGAVHLTQPANTLGAEVALAKDATRLYGSPVPVTSDPDLVCCALYGGINRMSDPTIGSGVNIQVQSGNRVTLRNPIGLYMKVNGIDTNAFSLPDDSPFTDVAACFKPIRPVPADVTDMIVRARFRVPDGMTFRGTQLRVGDLKINGEPIVTGGQVADVITMTLFAQAVPGGPAQQRVPCRGRACPDRERPSFLHVISFESTCPQDGIGALAVRLDLAARGGMVRPETEALEASAEMAAALPHRTRHAMSRARVFWDE
jgi:hypothetical protein